MIEAPRRFAGRAGARLLRHPVSVDECLGYERLAQHLRCIPDCTDASYLLTFHSLKDLLNQDEEVMAKAQVNECTACGRRARRICPALAGMICPACCGSGRGTKIECPPDCSYFPFGTAAYDLWLKIDEAWQPKALKYVVGKIGKEKFEAAAKQLAPSWLDKDHAFIEGAGAALLYYLAASTGDDLPEPQLFGFTQDRLGGFLNRRVDRLEAALSLLRSLCPRQSSHRMKISCRYSHGPILMSAVMQVPIP